jgi:hypothetical protein
MHTALLHPFIKYFLTVVRNFKQINAMHQDSILFIFLLLRNRYLTMIFLMNIGK